MPQLHKFQQAGLTVALLMLAAVLESKAIVGAYKSVADQLAAADGAEPVAFVEPHQIGRGEDVHPQARCFEDRAQICDRRALAVGAGDMDHRRQLALRANLYLLPSS